MVDSSAWYGADQAEHHNNRACLVGQRIRGAMRRSGDGGLPLCGQCAALNEASLQALPGGTARGPMGRANLIVVPGMTMRRTRLLRRRR
jgi:hypothetical protein